MHFVLDELTEHMTCIIGGKCARNFAREQTNICVSVIQQPRKMLSSSDRHGTQRIKRSRALCRVVRTQIGHGYCGTFK